MDLKQSFVVFKLHNGLICIIFAILIFSTTNLGDACELSITASSAFPLKEGDNVTFRCVSFPCPYLVDVTWTLDDVTVSAAAKETSYVNTYFVTDSAWTFGAIDKRYNHSVLYCNSTDFSDFVEIILKDTGDKDGLNGSDHNDLVCEQKQSSERVFLIVASILLVLALICLGVAIFLFLQSKGRATCCNQGAQEVRRRISTTLRGKKTLSTTPLSKDKDSKAGNLQKNGIQNDAFTDADREYSYADDPTKHYYLDLVDDLSKSKEGDLYEDVDLADVKIQESPS